MAASKASAELVVLRPEGMYCPAGGFYIDPWRPVAKAVITHAHADHARPGHGHYLAARVGLPALRARLGAVSIDTVEYGEVRSEGGVRLSLHPAGHVLGSAQVRLEMGGAVWVVSGDYKTAGVAPDSGAADPTCQPFEPIRCDVLISESTFGLPVYRWADQRSILAGINQWWAQTAATGRASVLFAYSLGKAQRILALLDPSIGPIYCHGAVETLNAAYRAAGVVLPETLRPPEAPGRRASGASGVERAGAMVLAPPSAAGTPWLQRFGSYSDACASGWMQVRGARRRQGLDRGFVLSDHADWPGLLWAIKESRAERVIVTHGQVAPLIRWLREAGLEAQAFETEFGQDESAAAAPAAEHGAAVAP